MDGIELPTYRDMSISTSVDGMVRYLALELFYGELRRRASWGLHMDRLLYQKLGIMCALYMTR